MHRDAGYEGLGANPGSGAMPTAEFDKDRSTDPLRAVLAAVLADLHSSCRDPWVVIGSAAACLVGAGVSVADLDVLTSVGERFRSHFARYRFPGLPVEVMGGLEVFGAGRWSPLQIDRIVRVSIAGLSVPVPSIAEQIRVLERFGRPKDRARIAVLQNLCEIGE